MVKQIFFHLSCYTNLRLKWKYIGNGNCYKKCEDTRFVFGTCTAYPIDVTKQNDQEYHKTEPSGAENETDVAKDARKAKPRNLTTAHI